MTEKIFKTIGEGGAHAHKIAPNKIETEQDGLHKHIFFISDRILMTDLSGKHSHGISLSANMVGEEKQQHKHAVTVRTADQGPVQVEVSNGERHIHELQSEMTTLSGVHRHTIELGGETFVSIVPGDLIEAVQEEAQASKQFKSLSLPISSEPMEVNFSLIKKLNQNQFKEIIIRAVEKSIIKRMASLGEGLKIESLILSKERFADVGVATRFVLDQGLDVKASQVLPDQGVFIFQVMSREAFEETTLQRIRITEGVEAVIGFIVAPEKAMEGMTDQTVASSETGDSLTDVQQSEENEMQKALVPNANMTQEQKRASQMERSRKFGIEALEGKGESLTFPAGNPTELSMYGDPVNLKYPFDTEARARNARVRFKQFASNYEMESSKKVINNRIVERELSLGIVPSFDENDPLDRLLSRQIRDRIGRMSKGIDNMESLKQKFANTLSTFDVEEKACAGGKKPKKTKEDKPHMGEGKNPKEKKPMNKSFKVTYEVVSKNLEKRLITGPVLVPDNIDLQDDIVSADEIEKAAHGYMIKLAYRDEPSFLKELGFKNVDKAGGRGFQHMDFSRKMAVVETFIAPVDMEINGRTIIKGTWVMTMKVFDDEVWNLVKAGRITGFSIGGHSKSRPAQIQE